jgi:SAM-dependent methyltransferase
LEIGGHLIICPDCSSELSGLFSRQCGYCGWASSPLDGIPMFFPSSQASSPISQSYKANYDIIADEDLLDSIVDERFVENLAKNLVKRVGGNLSDLNICDIGSGKGFAARLLLAHGARSVVAVDIASSYLEALRGTEGLQPVLANAEALPFQNEFDVIISTDVMEHVLNVGSFLYCINRALKPGGRFILRVPYRENLLTYSPHFGCRYQFVHLRTFNRASLKDCLEQGGFRVNGTRLDGFFWGKPQPFWGSSLAANWKYYEKARTISKRWLGIEESDVTLLNPRMLSVWMTPSMIVADAVKVKELPASLLKPFSKLADSA